MPNWHEVLAEISSTQPENGISPFDLVRRKYLAQLAKYTGRNVIAYYSGFLSKPNVFGTQIFDDDKNGFMLCCHEIDRSNGLDLFIHTPGGDLYATESLINYIRQMFGNDVRAIVPQIAMSGGTMISSSCKSIILGKHSNLGPVDPQINGIPAHAVQKQFQKAYDEIKADPRTAPIWQPMLGKLNLSFIQECDWAIEAAKSLVSRVLLENMFNGEADAEQKVDALVNGFSDLGENKSHSKHFHIDECEQMGLKIERLEDDPNFQDLVLTIHHCYMHALSNSACIKIIENHDGRAVIKNAQHPQ